jgi:hypothetical protein
VIRDQRKLRNENLHICTSHRIDKIKSYEMAGAYSTHRGNEKCIQKFVGLSEGSRDLSRLGVDGISGFRFSQTCRHEINFHYGCISPVSVCSRASINLNRFCPDNNYY